MTMCIQTEKQRILQKELELREKVYGIKSKEREIEEKTQVIEEKQQIIEVKNWWPSSKCDANQINNSNSLIQ